MRVAVISHTYVLLANRGKFEKLASLLGLRVVLVVPRAWKNRDIRQRFRAEPPYEGSFSVAPVAGWSFGFGSLTTYSPLALWRLIREFRPDLLHLEEEPWTVAAFEVALISRLLKIPLTFFTWENTDRRLPMPFRIMRWVLFSRAAAAVAGSTGAKALLERHGFAKPVIVLPQLGVETSRQHVRATGVPDQPRVIGYVGRLVPQKGLLRLLEAVARLPRNVRLMVVGTGPLRNDVIGKCRSLGIELNLHEGVSHAEIPRYLQSMDVLVLPSLTTTKWKEQFGHVLIEAMACGVPVVGSNSGAIPEVIGDAGIVVPEGNVEALTEALQRLLSAPELRADLSARGRARVSGHYTNVAVAHRLAAFWQDVV